MRIIHLNSLKVTRLLEDQYKQNILRNSTLVKKQLTQKIVKKQKPGFNLAIPFSLTNRIRKAFLHGPFVRQLIRQALSHSFIAQIILSLDKKSDTRIFLEKLDLAQRKEWLMGRIIYSFYLTPYATHRLIQNPYAFKNIFALKLFVKEFDFHKPDLLHPEFQPLINPLNSPLVGDTSIDFSSKDLTSEDFGDTSKGFVALPFSKVFPKVSISMPNGLFTTSTPSDLSSTCTPNGNGILRTCTPSGLSSTSIPSGLSRVSSRQKKLIDKRILIQIKNKMLSLSQDQARFKSNTLSNNTKDGAIRENCGE